MPASFAASRKASPLPLGHVGFRTDARKECRKQVPGLTMDAPNVNVLNGNLFGVLSSVDELFGSRRIHAEPVVAEDLLPQRIDLFGCDAQAASRRARSVDNYRCEWRDAPSTAEMKNVVENGRERSILLVAHELAQVLVTDNLPVGGSGDKILPGLECAHRSLLAVGCRVGGVSEGSHWFGLVVFGSRIERLSRLDMMAV